MSSVLRPLICCASCPLLSKQHTEHPCKLIPPPPVCSAAVSSWASPNPLTMSAMRVDAKVVMLGKESVGKTSLVERYVHHRFLVGPYQNVSVICSAFDVHIISLLISSPPAAWMKGFIYIFSCGEVVLIRPDSVLILKHKSTDRNAECSDVSVCFFKQMLH